MLENPTPEQTKTSSKVFDLIFGRVLKKAYLDFDEKIKKSIKEMLAGKKISKKQMPDLKALFDQESKTIEQEIKTEIENQNGQSV